MAFLKNRLALLLLAVLMVPVLAACGGTGASPTAAPATEPTAAPATEPTAASATEPTAAPATEPTAAPSTSATGLPEVDPAAVTGNIVTAGSSTVFPLSQAMAERFTDEGYAGNITIDSVGTGAGFERFCTAGETDISNASRPINGEETAACQTIGREPIEFRVGTDALAVVVSAENAFLEELTLEDLARIFNGEAKTWSEINPSYPAEPIQLFSPGSDSGTYDYFVEAVLDDDDAKLQASGAQFSENDNVLVQGVEGSQYAIGYFGYAYYAEESDRLKAVKVAGVEPNQANVDNGTYPLARPLFIYSTAEIMQEKPQVAAFINFYLSFVDEEIIDAGYFPAPDADLQGAKEAWLTAMGAAPAATSGGATGLPEVDPVAVTGNIVTAGSSTVFPLSQRMAERFSDEGYAGNITIDSVGTGAGFERFCTAGETDISNASRAIKAEETANCQKIGREPIEFRVGTDALAIVVSAENTFLEEITVEDLARVFNGEVKTWSELNPSYPAEPIQLFSPGSDSGTYDYFVEAVLKTDETKLQASGAQFSENDNVLVQGVEGSPYAIGYFGYAYFAEAGGKLKALKVNAVEPDEANVDNGTYPLARPLFIYSTAEIMQEKPQVAAFINFYLNYVDEEIIDVGYFPAPDADLQGAKEAWLAAMGE